jgi:uncharacterized protein YfiM (DUF2279 family)
MTILKASILSFFCFIVIAHGVGQDIKATDTAKSYNPTRFKIVVISEPVAWVASLYFLNDLWYKNFPRSSFHFFNDNNEWLQLDKFGHASSAYMLSMAGYESFKWTGINDKKAVWFGGAVGFFYESVIEILDGFSAGWGFSPGDETANTLGTALFIGQQLFWQEQKIFFKRSYHNTGFAKYRPNLLGSNLLERINKDYNGLTFWFSGNISSFLRKDAKFPQWLNVAIGYGGEGLVGAKSNPNVSENGETIPYYRRYRQFYISPDIDFSRIRTKSKLLKKVFFVLNIVKFPAPTLEFSKEKKIRFIPVYF